MDVGKVQEQVELAKRAYEAYDFDGAYEAYKGALEILNRESSPLKEKKLWTEIYKGIIDALDKGGKWLRALEYAGILISEARNKGEKRLEVEARLMACRVLLNHGNWEEARKRYEAVLPLAEKSGAKADIAECNYGLAYIDWRKGDTNAARFKAKKCIELVGGASNSLLQSKALILLATIEEAVGKTPEAIELFKDAISKLRTMEPNEELARAYNNLGEAYKGIDDYHSAAEQYEECIIVARKVKSKRGELYGLANTAECYAFLGRIKEAKAQIREIEELLKEAKEKYIIAQVPHIRGLIAYAEKKYAAACDEYKTALQEFKKMGNPPYDVGISLFRYGEALYAMGERDKAQVLFEKAKRNFVEADAKLYLKRLKRYL